MQATKNVKALHHRITNQRLQGGRTDVVVVITSLEWGVARQKENIKSWATLIYRRIRNYGLTVFIRVICESMGSRSSVTSKL